MAEKSTATQLKVDPAKTGEKENLLQINREFQERSVVRRSKELVIPFINITKAPLNPDF